MNLTRRRTAGQASDLHNGEPSPGAGPFRRAAALAAAALLLLATHAILAHEKVAELWRIHGFEPDRHLIHGELIHYTLLLILGLPAALLLASAWTDAAWAKTSGWVDRAGYWLPALAAGAGACCISLFVTHGAWFTDDEQAYLFQMQGYLEGRLSVPALQPSSLFQHPFLVSLTKDGAEHWAGAYPVLQPALMALSSLLGSPLLSQWLCAGLISFAGGKLAAKLTGERRAGLLAAWLCATSPMLIGLAATYHSSVPACLLSILTLHACLRARERGGFARGALVGMLAGATFLTRVPEGGLIALACGGMLTWSARARWRAARPMLLGLMAAGSAALAVHTLVNLNTTGNWLETTYAVLNRQRGTNIGFHEVMAFGRSHSVVHGVSQTFTALARMNVWLFGWPVSLLVPLLALLRRPRAGAAVWLLALSAAQLAGYFFLSFGSVQDFGAAYHVWHVPLMAAVVAIVSVTARRFTPLGTRVALAMTLVSLISFWPTQVGKWRAVADGTLSSVRAAERATHGQKAIVLHYGVKRPGVSSWVHNPPAPYPGQSIWWAFDEPEAVDVLRRAFPNRALFRLIWEGDQARVARVPSPQ